MNKIDYFNRKWQQEIDRFKALIGLNSPDINLKPDCLTQVPHTLFFYKAIAPKH